MKTERLFVRSLICAPLTVIFQLLCIFYSTYLCLVEEGKKISYQTRKLKFCIYMEENIFSVVCMSAAYWKLVDILRMSQFASFLHY